MNISKYPGCLKPGDTIYCKKCMKALFDDKKVSHILNFNRSEFDKIKREQSDRFSIPGIQIKHSLKLENGELVLTEQNGEYFLKPIHSGQFLNLDQLPSNENLTMQITRQVYNISTADNAIIFSADDQVAYINKKFDVLENKNKLFQEDFAQISERTEEIQGSNNKYDFSYEEITERLKKYIKAYSVQIESYFQIVVFNYLFSIGSI
jgi:serine/threonine-protein kinase HipA